MTDGHVLAIWLCSWNLTVCAVVHTRSVCSDCKTEHTPRRATVRVVYQKWLTATLCVCLCVLVFVWVYACVALTARKLFVLRTFLV